MTTTTVYKYIKDTSIIYSESIPEDTQYEIYLKLVADLSKVLVSTVGKRRYTIYTQHPEEWQEIDDIWEETEQ